MTTRTTGSKKTSTKKASKVTKAATKKSSAATKRPTKKVVKKAAPKATKKSTAKTAAKKRPIVEAPNEQSFWTTDGQVLNSIVALNQALDEMQDAVYRYHVDKDRHDFADWVELVLDDPECAAALRRAKTPKTARTVVVRHLKFYNV